MGEGVENVVEGGVAVVIVTTLNQSSRWSQLDNRVRYELKREDEARTLQKPTKLLTMTGSNDLQPTK